MVKARKVGPSFAIAREPLRQVHPVIRSYPLGDDCSRAECHFMLMHNPYFFVVKERYLNLFE
jgi:hypothetical protein